MKRFLLSLMVVVLLTSSLVCSPIFCIKQAQAAAASSSMEKMPCCPKSDADKSHQMFKDCAKADFILSGDHHVLKKPDLGKTFTVSLDQIETHPLVLADYKFIRGPPPDWPAVSQTQPSIILSTLRIRE